jgi:hypothetical protein
MMPQSKLPTVFLVHRGHFKTRVVLPPITQPSLNVQLYRHLPTQVALEQWQKGLVVLLTYLFRILQAHGGFSARVGLA